MRLARYLVELKHEDAGAGSVHLDVSKRRLAALLGLKPESLSRVFASLAEYGVHVDGEHVTVTDFKLLEDLAQPDSDIDRE
jgi:CRP/FNR family transcriptional activator FtrB